MEMDSSLHWTMMKLNLKENGNRAFQNREFGDASIHYTNALQIEPKDTDLLSNRSMAYINIGCYNLALADAQSALQIKPNHEKCIFRKVKSLWGLNKYEEALNFLNTKVSKEILNLPLFTELVQKAEKMVEQSKGEFDIMEIMTLPRDKCLDLAEYTGPVEISEIPGKGRGLRVTRDIDPGQLLICSKAFAIVFEGEEKKKLMKLDVEAHDEDILVGMVCQKLSLNSDVREEFAKLYAGPDVSNNCDWKWDDSKEKSAEMVVEVNNRVSFNCFGGEKSTNPLGDKTPNFLGVWILPSYLNHNCLESNASWNAYGDMMLIRAVKSIKSGEEITIAYVSPENPHRQGMIQQKHKFKCHCRLCQLESTENAETVKSIQSTLKSIQDNLKHETDWRKQVIRVRKLISLRAGNPTANLALLQPCVEQVVGQLIDAEEWEIAAEIFEKARDVCSNNCYVVNSVYVDMTILRCYMNLGNEELVNKWVKQMQLDLIAAYGSLEPLRIIGKNIVSDMKDFGIDLFEMDRISITEIE